VTYHTVTNTQSSRLGERCHDQALLQIKSFDVTIEHVNSSCGSD
jgi:hypothetical protein